jgi:hypothetical protein
MELFVLILIAGVVGYLLAGSKYSQKIDETTGKAASTSKEIAGRTGDRIRRLFRSEKKTESSATLAESEAPAQDGKKPAEKSVSRRKSEEEEQPAESSQ